MQPALKIGDRILCNKLKNSQLNINDVIIFWKPTNIKNTPKETSYVMAKRIVGTAGSKYILLADEIQAKSPKFKLSNSNYTEQDSLLTIPKNNYFVQGDYAEDSRDSRYWGLVHDSLIIGKASFVVWSDWDAKKPPNERTLNWNRCLKKIPEPLN